MRNEILVAGPRFHDYTTNLGRLFERNGFDARIVDFPVLRHDLFHRRSDRLNTEKLNRQIAACVAEHDLHKVIIIKGDRVSRDTLALIKKKGVPLVLFLQDGLSRTLADLSVLEYYDKVLLFERTDKDLLSGIGIRSAYFGTPVSLQDYFPIESVSKDVDLCFVGSLSTDRVRVLEAVIERFSGLNITVHGSYLPRWKLRRLTTPNRLMKYYGRNYRKYFMNTTVPSKQANELYARTRICLNIQKEQSQWGCNYRTFEVLAAKQFQISSANPYLEHEFQNGGLIMFHSMNDLFDKIECYMADEKERLRHAEIGYHYVLQHSYSNKFALFDV